MIVDFEGYVLTSGFNGSPRDLPHCEDVGCLIEGGERCPECSGQGIVYLPSRSTACSACGGSGKIGGHCVRTVHDAMNAIIYAARKGVSLDGGIIYSTMRPCIRCTTALIQVGVVEAHYLHGYSSDDIERVETLFKSAGGRLIKATL